PSSVRRLIRRPRSRADSARLPVISARRINLLRRNWVTWSMAAVGHNRPPTTRSRTGPGASAVTQKADYMRLLAWLSAGCQAIRGVEIDDNPLGHFVTSWPPQPATPRTH